MGKKEENLCGEMQSRGMYASEGLWYGAPYMPVERLSQPVTPRENLLRYYRGEKYYWMPDIVSDQVDITPSCNPDVDASDFEGGYDAFGVKWIPVEGGMLPAFVEPGFILLEDIADWKSLKWPEPDDWGTGADAWQVQIDALDAEGVYEACGDELMMESYPLLPEGIHGDALEAHIRGVFEKFCIRHRGLVDFYDMEEGRWPESRRLIYKAGRKLALEREKKEERQC